MSDPDLPTRTDVIIAGYGLPGRAAADTLCSRGISHCVIELNAATVERCTRSGTKIIQGDCRDPQVLRRAGIETAQEFVVLVPDEKAAVEATAQARQLNPTIRILTRCHYTSTGMEAKARGADDVIVAEQVVAAEVSRRLGNST
jgi:voltage-gated potassium channel Kch